MLYYIIIEYDAIFIWPWIWYHKIMISDIIEWYCVEHLWYHKCELKCRLWYHNIAALVAEDHEISTAQHQCRLCVIRHVQFDMCKHKELPCRAYNLHVQFLPRRCPTFIGLIGLWWSRTSKRKTSFSIRQTSAAAAIAAPGSKSCCSATERAI